MENSANLDVLVAGAGPVGLTAACELARHGVRFRIVETRAAPSVTSKALGIFPRTLELFSTMGVVQPVVEAGQKLYGISISDRHGPLARIGFGDLPTPYRFAISLPQSRTEGILIEHLASFGARVDREVELAGFTQDENGVRALLRHHGEGNREERVSARWLIGCDGAHSSVRHILGSEFEGGRYDEGFILADVKIEGPISEHEPHLFFSGEGLLAIVPLGGNRGRVIVNVPLEPGGKLTGSDRPGPDLVEFQKLVDRRASPGIRLSDPLWLSRFEISHRKVRKFRTGRVFLAGDAAHIHSPAGGQGMNTGIQDAFNLVWKLALVARGRSPATLLESYDAEREPVARDVLRFTDRLTRMATLRNPFARGVRNLVLPMLVGSRKMEQKIAANIAELSINYRTSPIVADYGGSTVRAGDRAPDAVLTDAASGKTVRLFEMFRDPRHLLLFFEGPRRDEPVEGLLREIGQRFSDVVAVYLVAGEGSQASVSKESSPELPTVLNGSGMVHHRYGLEAGLVLVRPDGYTGFCSGLANAGKLREYLDTLFLPR